MNLKSRTDEELGELTYYLSQYNFEIKYIPGKINIEADSLSRNLVLEENENSEQILQVVNYIRLDAIKIDEEKNEAIKKIKTKLVEK